jgi:hypothetical protein
MDSHYDTLKMIQQTNSVDGEILQTAHSIYALRHIAAVVRRNNYVFVTKTQATAAGDPTKATWALAKQNMHPLNHYVDIIQTDLDLISVVVAFWENNSGPDYLQNALAIKNTVINIDKHLPTLSLLILEYLRQLNTALLKFNAQMVYIGQHGANIMVQF